MANAMKIVFVVAYILSLLSNAGQAQPTSQQTQTYIQTLLGNVGLNASTASSIATQLGQSLSATQTACFTSSILTQVATYQACGGPTLLNGVQVSDLLTLESGCLDIVVEFISNSTVQACISNVSSYASNNVLPLVLQLAPASCSSTAFNLTYLSTVQVCMNVTNPLVTALLSFNQSAIAYQIGTACNTSCGTAMQTILNSFGNCFSGVGASLVTGFTTGCQVLGTTYCATSLAKYFDTTNCLSLPTQQACSQHVSCVWASISNNMGCYFNTNINQTGACNDPCLQTLQTSTSAPAVINQIFKGLCYAFAPCLPCPDGTTCAPLVSQCSCVQTATLSNVTLISTAPQSSSVDVTQALALSLALQYRATSGTCTSSDLSPFLTYAWTVTFSNGTTVPTGTLSLTGSSLGFSALFFTPGNTYTASVSITGLLSSNTNTQTYTFTTIAPVPVVSIQTVGGALRIPSTQNFTIPVYLVDNFPGASPTYAWSCALIGGGSCPSYFTSILAGGTLTNLTLTAPIPSGSYNITLTYKSVSSSVTVNVASGNIPLVNLLVQTTAIYSTNYFLSTQQLVFAAAVVYNSTANLTYQWVVNGVTQTGTSNVLYVTASTLMVSTSNNPTLATANTILLFANASDGTYGQTSTTVYVAPAITASLSLTDIDAPLGQTFAIALNERLTFTTTLSISSSNLPFSAPYALSYGYIDQIPYVGVSPVVFGTSGLQQTFTAPCPFPANLSTSGMTFTFFVQVYVNGIYGANATATLSLNPPPINSALNSQLSGLTSSTSASSILSAGNTIANLMGRNSNATQNQAVAQQLVGAFVNNLGTSGASSMTSSQQAQMMSSLTTALTVLSPTQAASYNANILNLMTSAISSTSFSAANGQVALNVLSRLSSTSSLQSVCGTLATSIANNAPLGSSSSITSNGMTVVGFRQTGANLGGSSVSCGTGASISMPTGISIPGVSSTSVVGISSVAYSTNPMGTAGLSGALTASVVEFDISVGGTKTAVTGLAKPITIALTSTNPSGMKCIYFDTTLNAWSSSGMTVTSIVGTTVSCSTTHLTVFGGGSSASALAVSALALLLVALVQLAL